jgi:hypothetical protein
VLVAAADGSGERPWWTCCPAVIALGVAGREAVDAETARLLLASRSSTGRRVIADTDRGVGNSCKWCPVANDTFVWALVGDAASVAPVPSGRSCRRFGDSGGPAGSSEYRWGDDTAEGGTIRDGSTDAHRWCCAGATATTPFLRLLYQLSRGTVSHSTALRVHDAFSAG